MGMSLLALIVILVVLALAIWGVQKYMPQPSPAPDGTAFPLKNIICLLLVLCACLALLAAFGIIPGGYRLR